MSRTKNSVNATKAVGRHQGVKTKRLRRPPNSLAEASAMFNAAYDQIFCASRPWLAYREGTFAR